MTDIIIPKKRILVDLNRTYTGAEVFLMVETAHADGYDEGRADTAKGFVKLYAEHMETAQIWFQEFNARIAYFLGAVTFSVGESQNKAIKLMRTHIADLLDKASIINGKWQKTHSGELIDPGYLMDLYKEMQNHAIGNSTAQHVLDKLPQTEVHKMHMKTVLENAIGGKTDVVTRIAQRVNELISSAKATGRKKPTYPRMATIMTREWQEKVDSGLADEVDKEVYKTLKDSVGVAGYVQKCWQNRYKSKS